MEICWLRVVHASRIERDLIFPLQIKEKAACILVLGCPCVEHDQIFPLQFEEVGNILISIQGFHIIVHFSSSSIRDFRQKYLPVSSNYWTSIIHINVHKIKD